MRTVAQLKANDCPTAGLIRMTNYLAKYRPLNSTPEGQRAVARHYGFTDEEFDYILNYDIKYRLGRELADEES